MKIKALPDKNAFCNRFSYLVKTIMYFLTLDKEMLCYIGFPLFQKKEKKKKRQDKKCKLTEVPTLFDTFQYTVCIVETPALCPRNKRFSEVWVMKIKKLSQITYSGVPLGEIIRILWSRNPLKRFEWNSNIVFLRPDTKIFILLISLSTREAARERRSSGKTAACWQGRCLTPQNQVGHTFLQPVQTFSQYKLPKSDDI